MSKLIIVSDGASHNNGGECGAAFIAYKETGEKIHSDAQSIGIGSNTFAEYQAMINAITWAIGFLQDEEKSGPHEPVEEITFLSDSNLVVSHITKKFIARTAETKKLLAEVLSDLDELAAYNVPFKVEHAPREYTQDVDELARAAAKGAVSEEFEKKYAFLKK